MDPSGCHPNVATYDRRPGVSMNHPHCFCEPPLSKMHNYFFPELNVTATSGRGLHCTPPLHPSTAFFHCVPPLRPSTAPLHCIPPLHPSAAPLLLCPSTVSLHCAPPLHSSTVVLCDHRSGRGGPYRKHLSGFPRLFRKTQESKNRILSSSKLAGPNPPNFPHSFFFNSSTRAWGITQKTKCLRI